MVLSRKGPIFKATGAFLRMGPQLVGDGMRAQSAVETYYRLHQKLGGQALCPYETEQHAESCPVSQQVEDSCNCHPVMVKRGAFQYSKRPGERSDLIRLVDISLRLSRAEKQNPKAYLIFVSWVDRPCSVRQLTKRLKRLYPDLPWGRKTISDLLEVGENNIQSEVDDL